MESLEKALRAKNVFLALLAPDLVDAILGEQTDQMLMLAKLQRPLSANWEGAAKAVPLVNRWGTGTLPVPCPSLPGANQPPPRTPGQRSLARYS
jgi:hypothetical protein